MAKSRDIHLNDILRLHFDHRTPQKNGTRSHYKFSIDMLVVYYEGVFFLVNLETGMVFRKIPHEEKWTLNKLKLYHNTNSEDLLPVTKVEFIGEMRERL